MKRATSIALLFTLLSLAMSPLMAEVRPSHPAACPRAAKAQHCHGGGSSDDGPAIAARAADCPMRCCVTLRAGAHFAPASRIALTALGSTSLENPVRPLPAIVSAPQVWFERGPPRA